MFGGAGRRPAVPDAGPRRTVDQAHAEKLGIAFIPWFPLAGTGLPDPGGAVAQVAARRQASISQLALAWLLRRSPVMLPIPGTSSIAHLEENLAAAAIDLTDEEFQILEQAA
ncbi:aldo/keto reductase [Nonomuraea sp. NPDC048892]|uniref:aldo/keto reductase n=1 Tax=Nonomuraea sp. NPDC048892 TaxID=3154624 RepID=UPI0033D4599D